MSEENVGIETNDQTGSNPLKLSNSLYDLLKKFALIFLPAAATLYFTLATIYGWPDPERVLATVVAVETFLGVLLGLSTSAHKAEVQRRADSPSNALIVGQDGEVLAQFDFDPKDTSAGEEITLTVVRPQGKHSL